MSNSLKDQLLKAGLVTKNEVKKKPKNKAPTPPKKKRKKTSESTLRTQRAMLNKAKKDKRLNEQRQEAAEKKARYAQIKQLVEGGKLDRKDGETSYNFTYNKKIKTIYVTQEQHKQLSNDQLTIIVLDGERFEIVPNKVAEQVEKRESERVIKNTTSNKDKSAEDDNAADDPYSDYQIPDDLIW